MRAIPNGLQVLETQVLVLGGGLAGQRAAAAARAAGAQVVMAMRARGASPHIIGFNVPLGHADARDSPEVYAEDILRGGCGLNDGPLVEALAEGACAAFGELVDLGMPFARQGDGVRYAQRHLSGNTWPRSVYHPDGTGRLALEYLSAHCAHAGVDVQAGWQAVALLQDAGEVVGALLVGRTGGERLVVRAGATVLATGGLGALYADSTYPADVGAASYALALEAGATLIDMEFVQFEPTVTVHPAGCRGMEMPTAMLGDGALLLNAQGERFMFRHNPESGERGMEKARMALCIQAEIDAGRGFADGTVAFDTTVLAPERLESYVGHCRRLRAAGLDPAREAPRVRPAAHSQMGGVRTDAQAWSGVPGLYVAGEAAGGVHGASRLAGNGASDVIVFGGIAGRAAARGRLRLAGRDWGRVQAAAEARVQQGPRARSDGLRPDELKARLRQVMAQAAGLYRSAASLGAGLEQLRGLQGALEDGLQAGGEPGAGLRAVEARHMLAVADAVLVSALERTESRGAHQRSDHARRDDAAWLRHVAVRSQAQGGLRVETQSRLSRIS